MALDRVLISRVLIFLLLAVQGAILDAFLIHNRSELNYAWIACDLVVLFVWAVLIVEPRLPQLIVSRCVYGCCATRGRNATDGHHRELRTMWVSWLVYSCVSLGPRVGVAYYTVAPDLSVEPFLGSNLLKFSIALTAALFLCLIYAHVGAEPYTYEKFYLERMQTGVVLDIFDSGEFLDIFFTEERRDEGGEEFVFTRALQIAIIVFGVVNLVAPFVALVEVERKHRPEHRYSLGAHRWSNTKLIYLYLNTFVVNLPFAILRIVLWVGHDKEVSVLLVKNIIFIIMNVMDISEYYGEVERCPTCHDFYPLSRLPEHNSACRVRHNSTRSAGQQPVAMGNDDAVGLVQRADTTGRRSSSGSALLPVTGDGRAAAGGVATAGAAQHGEVSV
eukprot:scpid71472/ scgid35488/ 